MATARQVDPTRTTLLRRKFMADMTRRFKKVSFAIQELVVDDDAFGLVPGILITFNDKEPLLKNQQVQQQAWRFQTNPQKVRSYRLWLGQQVRAEILTVEGAFAKPWTAPYIESAYKKGLLRAWIDVRALEELESLDFIKGSRAEFLAQAFQASIPQQKIELLYQRAFTELEGVTAAMDQQMSRILATGLTRGDGPRKIARDLRKNVTKMTKTRAIVIARTEIVRAHSEGQLDAFELLGVEEVGVQVEWLTAGDDRVCLQCVELEGTIFTIDEARDLIPRHPNCRCAWIPADKKRPEQGQLRGSLRDRAVDRSIQAEGPTGGRVRRSKAAIKARSTWIGKEL
jgi:SPP1 gp7 family putative phage head morphogenesis protein